MPTRSIVVFGAGGRAGRHVVGEARRRGHRVTAALRADADITDPEAVARVAAGHDAAVHAVTPASGPEELGDVDPTFFVRAADALIAARIPRIVAIGLFATLRGPDGAPAYEDEALFPPFLRPFAQSHAAGATRLAASERDWAVLVPPARLELEAPRTGRYTLGGDRLPDAAAALSYADLAVAIVDEIESPTLHGAVAAVFG